MRFLIAALLSLVAVPVATADAQSRLHKNELFGYQLKAPKDWTQIPLKVDEDWLLAKWKSDKTYFWTEKNGGWTWEHQPELMVIGFVHRKPGEEEKEEKEKDLEDLDDEDVEDAIRKALGASPYKDYEDYLDRTYRGGGFYISDRKQKKIKGIEVTQIEVKVEKLTTTGPKRIITWIYHQEHADVAVQFEVLENAYSKLKSTINSSLKSFKVIPRSDLDLPSQQSAPTGWITISEMNRGTPAERKKKRIESENQHREKAIANLPDGWTHKDYGRVFVISHVDARYDKKVVAQVEALLDWCDENLHFIGPDEYVRAPIIRICKDRDEERSFSQGQSAGAFWSIGTSGIEITTHKDEDGMLGWETDYMNRRVFDLWFRERDAELFWALPTWLENGLREYVENLRLKGKKLDFRPDHWDKDDLREMVREGRAERPRDLMKMISSDFYGGSGGWDRNRQAGALVEFFLSGAASKSKRTKGALPNFIRDLKDVITEIEEEEEKKKDEPEKDDEPQTEEEEDALYKARQEEWKNRERRVLDEAFNRAFGGWSDKDWDAFEKVYFNSID